jgi:peptidyl-prolyl cis-trans isomerase B (cyclophilin B)
VGRGRFLAGYVREGAPVASSKKRQRELAHAKAKRQSARRAEAARRRRQWRAGTAAVLTLAVIGLGATWAAGGFKSTPKKSAQCAWNTPADTTNTDLRDVGKPPTTGIPTSGTKTMTLALTQGSVDVQLDLAKVPCTAESFTYLASKKTFFDGSKCQRLMTSGYYALQCGDPASTGKGGPKYTFVDENLPPGAASPSAQPSGSASTSVGASASAASAAASSAAASSASAAASPSGSASTAVAYTRGTVAFYNTTADTNGSQFFIFYQDSPTIPKQYSIIGTVTKGLDVIDKIAAAGVAPASDGTASTDGAPKTDVVIQSLTMGPVVKATPASAPAPSGSANPSGSAPGAGSTASGTASASASTKP